MKKPELLCPAGSPEVLRIAVRYGADAVYIGGEAFSLRAKARNFSLEDMAASIDFAHSKGVRVYVTANILARDEDLPQAAEYFRELAAMKPSPPDALIISDPGIYDLAVEICPDIERHISTQANNTNYGTYLFWHRLGAKRVVSARELSMEELSQIRSHIPEDMEIETFIHGSMCISYSGRCLLSKFLTGRDANRGECTHPCRWKYALMEETSEGEYFPIYENDRGSFILNSRDLCMVDHIPELVEAGIDSFKIEGRMKNALYVATMADTYRRAIDDYFADPELYLGSLERYRAMIRGCTYRKYTTGFFFPEKQEDTQIYDGSTYERGRTYLGYVEKAEGPVIYITQKNKFLKGDEIEVMKPGEDPLKVKVLAIENDEGEEMESAPHAGQHLKVTLDRSGAEELDVLCV